MILEFWEVHEDELDEYVIWGDIYGDKKGRFRDGTRIHTSGISHKSFPTTELKQGTTILTRNSIYQLGVRK